MKKWTLWKSSESRQSCCFKCFLCLFTYLKAVFLCQPLSQDAHSHSGSEVAEMMQMHRQFSVQTPRKWVLGWLNVEICWNSTELSALLLLDGNERSSSLVILMPELGILMLSLLSHFLQLVWAFEPSQSCHPSFWLKWTCAIDFCLGASCASGATVVERSQECTEIILIQFHPPGRAQLTFAAALLALRVPPWWNEARECTEIILIQFHPPG